MDTLWRDVCFGLRLLAKNKGFAAVAVLALALGIGPNTAIFSVIYATLLAPMPYPQPDQLVVVWSKIQGSRNVVSAGDFLDWQHESKAFQGIGAASGSQFNLATAGAGTGVRPDIDAWFSRHLRLHASVGTGGLPW